MPVIISPTSTLERQHPNGQVIVCFCMLLPCPDEVDVGRKTRKRKTPASAAGKRKTRGAMTSARVPKSFQRLLEEVSVTLSAGTQ